MSSSEIPDAWPPNESAAPVSIAPVFPLPRVFLYPHVVMPLHIFEPRYLQMIEDLLDRRGWLVITPICEGHEEEHLGAPPIYPVGGLGEIVKHSRLDDGRFLITLAGLGRVRLLEVESDRQYRKVQFEKLHEVMPDHAETGRLKNALRKAILERSEMFLNLPDDLPLRPMVDLLLQNLDLPVATMAEAFAEPVLVRRAQLALAEHAVRR
ncbi:MAG: Lon protease-like protein [Candidatus Paceibacteria bacterium]|jgi:Lon protease-like protein